VRARQARGRHERIVARIQHEVRHAHVAEQRLGRASRPVVERVAEPVHRRGVQVVERVQVARPPQHVGVDRVAEPLRLVARLGFQRREEHPRVHAVEAAPDRMAAGDEVERRADRCRGGDEARLRAALAEPLRQHVAAERDADRVQRSRRPARVQPAQHPVPLFRVARVIRAQQQVRFAGAAAEVHDQRAPAAIGEVAHRRARVMAARVALEAVEEREQRGVLRPGLRLREVDIDEVAVGRRPALAAVGDRRQRHEAGRPDRLQVAAAQPAWRPVGRGNERHGGGSGPMPPRGDGGLSAGRRATRRSSRPRPPARAMRGAAPSSSRPPS
jgi:hypothetical protein